MPHLKCQPCGNRLYRAGSRDQVGDLCPVCGSLLEPVGELAEIAGFRRLASRAAADSAASNAHQPLADRLGDLIVRRQTLPGEPGPD